MLTRLVPSAGSIFGLGAVSLAFLLLRERPRVLVASWLAVICFLPWWMGTRVLTFEPVAVLFTLLTLVSLLPAMVERWTLVDWTVTCFFLVCALPIFVGGSTRSATFGLLVVWLPAYLAGRLVLGRVNAYWLYGCIGVFFTIVSGLAVIEYLASWNPFVKIRVFSGSTYALWGTLQERGGQLRAEGAFGHSIALGASIALAIPMTLASRFRFSRRLLMVALMLGASAVTFSRTGMFCSVLAVGLSVIFLREGLSARARGVAIAVVVTLAALIAPLVSGTFAAAGSESTDSSHYRDQLTSLIPHMSLVGLSDSAQRLADGTVWFGHFRSIDSELILLGLTYGSVAAAGVLLLLALSIGAVLLGRATAPSISLTAQIPSLATVALITQYSVLFWFVAGVAAGAHALQAASVTADVPFGLRPINIRQGASSLRTSARSRKAPRRQLSPATTTDHG